MNGQATVKKAKAITTKAKKPRSLEKTRSRAGWFFVLPFVATFLAVYIPIIIDSIKYSFNRIEMLKGGGYTLHFVGWQNYSEALFVNPNFVKILTSGIQQLIFDIPAIVIFALFIAVILNQKMPGRALFRTVFFIPVIISTGIVESLDASNVLLDYMGSTSTIDTGTGTQSQASEIISSMDIQRLFANMKIGTELVDYVVQLVNNIYSIINRSGVQMLIFLAGLQSISPAIYESAFMEGASAWETFWKITFPMISPMILVNAIYTVIDSFTSESNQVMTFISGIYHGSEPNGDVISSAMSWMYFLIVILIIAVVSLLLSAYVFYQRRD
ncbi:MAG: sugar ABC transporter permease [Clostridia bacterium]|nr:sugar ABC transporter permease [Clostridia bacterium]